MEIEKRLLKMLIVVALLLAIVLVARLTSTPDKLATTAGVSNVETAPLQEEQPLSTAEPLVLYYDVPLSEELQDHLFSLCDEYIIDPALVISVIFHESTYRPHAINGTSYGLMQVNQPYHTERMRRLGATDLFDPFDNVTVGIDILAEEISRHDTLGEALTAYNAGATGAYKLYFSKGITANTYAKKVLKTHEELSHGTVN